MDESDSEKEGFLVQIAELLHSLDSFKKNLGINLFQSIVGEFSSEKASAVGLPWDFHYRCRKSFEVGALNKILSLSLGALPTIRNDQLCIKSCLELVAQILSWEFTNGEFAGTFEKKGRDPGKDDSVLSCLLPSSWRDLIVSSPALLDLIFEVRWVQSIRFTL